MMFNTTDQRKRSILSVILATNFPHFLVFICCCCFGFVFNKLHTFVLLYYTKLGLCITIVWTIERLITFLETLSEMVFIWKSNKYFFLPLNDVRNWMGFWKLDVAVEDDRVAYHCRQMFSVLWVT